MKGRFLELFTGKTNSRAILLEIEVNVCPLLRKGQILSFKGYYWIIGQIRPLGYPTSAVVVEQQKILRNVPPYI